MYTELSELLRHELKPYLKLKMKFIFTGHSMGGGLATLAAMDLVDLFPSEDLSLIVFGTPRVGNRQFAEALSSQVPRIRRVIEANDVVPHIPGRCMGYYHAGSEVYVYHNTFYWSKQSENPRFSQRHFPWYHKKAHLRYRGQAVFGNSIS
jgi:predicted lipase